MHLSRGLDAGDRAQVAAAARAGTLMPLEGLAAQFPTRPDRFGLAYAESSAAVDRLVARHGNESVLRLVRALRAGDSFDEAFEAATGEGFSAFEDDWLESLGAQRPAPARARGSATRSFRARPQQSRARCRGVGPPAAPLLP